MDQSLARLLDALRDHQRRDRYDFTLRATGEVAPIPASLMCWVRRPGERRSEDVIDQLRYRVEAGKKVPNPADSTPRRFRVAA